MSRKRKSLEHLKTDLSSGDIGSSLTFLKQNDDPEYLKIFREQKILFKVKNIQAQAELGRAYAEAARRLIKDQSEIEKIDKYLQFALLSSQLHRQIINRARPYAKQIKQIAPTEFMRAAWEVIEEGLRLHTKALSEGVERLAGRADLGPGDISDTNMWLWQEFSAVFADASYAVARAVNEFTSHTDSKKTTRSDRKLYVKAKGATKALVQLSNYLNSIEYAVDMVSFGDWYVSKIEEKDNIIEVRFDVQDLALFMARRLSLRQILSEDISPRKSPRPLRLLLQDFAFDMAVEAAKYYETKTEITNPPEEAIKGFEALVLQALSSLYAEDELLLAASSGNEVSTYYLTYLALQCSSLAASFVSKHCAKDLRKRLSPPEVPVGLIKSAIVERGYPPELVDEALNSFIVTLPSASHFDLIRAPFITLQGKVYNLPHVSGPPWTAAVRATLVKGNRLAKAYGEVWEKSIAETLQSWNWSVIAVGKRLKKDGRVITDIDILAYKDGTVLIIQSKAIASVGLTIFDHWKSRETVTHGVEQARLAKEAVEGDPNLIKDILRANKIDGPVERVYGVVVTTSPVFTGWKLDGIPVIRAYSLLNILQGATVRYSKADGSEVGSKSYASRSDVTPHEFMQLLETPMEWRIVNEDGEIFHAPTQIGNVRMLLPDLARKIKV